MNWRDIANGHWSYTIRYEISVHDDISGETLKQKCYVEENNAEKAMAVICKIMGTANYQLTSVSKVMAYN